MAITVTPITVPDLTTTTVDGTGVFDVLMQANKAHLEQEYTLGRIKGSEYATVYLGSLETVMNTALQFLLNKDKAAKEAELLDQQILLAQAEILKTNATKLQIEAQTNLTEAQTDNAVAELAILQANLLKVPAEIDVLEAQSALTTQQKTNLIAEALNIPKQGQLLDKQVLDLVQKTLNAVIEGTVLTATECKLSAEFDQLVAMKLKTDQETALLLQKVATEKAQVSSVGVDADSVVGRQKSLYHAQTRGFQRDAEQKAAKIMVDTWNTRRMTDEATEANISNQLRDEDIGVAIGKLATGVAENATP